MARETIGPWLAKKAILEKLHVRRPLIFDVGAHFGAVTDIYLRMWDNVKIYCFEPERGALEKLHMRYDDEDRVVIEPYAISDKRKTNPVPFYFGGREGEMSSLKPRPSEGRRYYRAALSPSQEVLVESLDEYAMDQGIECVHVLKLDIQGNELEALKGASNFLTAGTITLIYCEVLFVEIYEGASDFFEIWRYLRRFGYSLFDLYGFGRSPVNRQLTYADALFVNPQVREKVLNAFPDEWLRKSRLEALGAPSI